MEDRNLRIQENEHLKQRLLKYLAGRIDKVKSTIPNKNKFSVGDNSHIAVVFNQKTDIFLDIKTRHFFRQYSLKFCIKILIKKCQGFPFFQMKRVLDFSPRMPIFDTIHETVIRMLPNKFYSDN